jgi:hypothetical protein
MSVNTIIPRPPIQNNRILGQSSIFVGSVNPVPALADMDSNAASRRLMSTDRNDRHPKN